MNTAGKYAVGKFVIHKANPTEFDPIEQAVNWSNTNAAQQNKNLEFIISQHEQIKQKLADLKARTKPRRHRLTTKQLSATQDVSRPIMMIRCTGVDDEAYRLQQLRDKQAYYGRKKKSAPSWKNDKPTKPTDVWEESPSGNNTKGFWRSYAMPPQQPWPVKTTGWGDDSDSSSGSNKTSRSSGSTKTSRSSVVSSAPILMENQPHIPVVPTYVDTTGRFRQRFPQTRPSVGETSG